MTVRATSSPARAAYVAATTANAAATVAIIDASAGLSGAFFAALEEGDLAGAVDTGGGHEHVAGLDAGLAERRAGVQQRAERGLQQRDAGHVGLLGVLAGDVDRGRRRGDHEVEDAGRAVHADRDGRVG